MHRTTVHALIALLALAASGLAAPTQAPAASMIDVCAANGWYGDGICDIDCPLPDPDCAVLVLPDVCADEGWYGDGICDIDCPLPDPDCGGDGYGDGDDKDWCADQGWYGDGICDEDCPLPDPDC